MLGEKKHQNKCRGKGKNLPFRLYSRNTVCGMNFRSFLAGGGDATSRFRRAEK